MSANPTRVEWEEPATADPASPSQEGNRVLESIARQEALRALLSFSDLHEQIRNRRAATGQASGRDLFETERFILDEVLQLICDRAQAITQADGIVIAVAGASRAEAGNVEMICRASAGPLAVERGVRLISDSRFLQESFESGRILRCDDCDTDARVEKDFAYQMGARSTVLVPLRGRRQQIGVLQAFSFTARAFTDHDIRCFDLFSELVLSALKPEDQDRRIHWLSDVAGEILQPKPDATTSANPTRIEVPSHSVETVPGTIHAHVAPDALLHPVAPSEANTTRVEHTLDAKPAAAELPVFGTHGFEIEALSAPSEPPIVPPFLNRLSVPASSRPGLSVVMGLVALAALFSAGAWWGTQVHHKTSVANAEVASGTNSLRSVTTPSVPQPEELTLEFADNLMNPAKLDTAPAPLTPTAEDKLRALPKITGVRHWSSSMGSTVVIDMQDQVPYEVHRLMSPERIYFDLHDTALSPELDGKAMDIGDASLTRVRIAQPVAGVTRVVLDTRDDSNFSVSMESNPYRLVVELRGSEKTLMANRQPAIRATAPAKAAPVAALPVKASEQPMPARTGRFRIVLDAGHGGWDLGTVGRKGLLEKDLVLDVTQRLGKLLQARLGSEVMLTRTSDSYLSLDQRADFANQAQADVFVSVHANYSKLADARGVETYYTNLFSAPGSKEAEKHDDGSFPKFTPVSLSAGGLHERVEESRRLAASVQRSLYGALASNSPDIRNRGIKDSAFAVLTGTTMPAILTEISFVSSPADEQNLQSAAYRQQIAEALYKGIARYQESSPRAKVAQLQTAAARR